MTTETDLDFVRSEVLSWIILGGPEGWSITYNKSTGPEFVLTAKIEIRVTPGLGTDSTLVNVVGKGAAARAIIAAENQNNIDRYINPEHPSYRHPPELGDLLNHRYF